MEKPVASFRWNNTSEEISDILSDTVKKGDLVVLSYHAPDSEDAPFPSYKLHFPVNYTVVGYFQEFVEKGAYSLSDRLYRGSKGIILSPISHHQPLLVSERQRTYPLNGLAELFNLSKLVPHPITRKQKKILKRYEEEEERMYWIRAEA